VISGRRAKDTEQGQVDGGGGVVEEEQEEENKGGTRDEERESAKGGTTVRNSSEARTFLLVRNAGFSSRCRFLFFAHCPPPSGLVFHTTWPEAPPTTRVLLLSDELDAHGELETHSSSTSARGLLPSDALDARGELQASSSSPSFMTTGLPANSRTTTQNVSTNHGDEEVSWLWCWRRCGRRRRRRRW